jgi:hypothetical protein
MAAGAGTGAAIAGPATTPTDTLVAEVPDVVPQDRPTTQASTGLPSASSGDLSTTGGVARDLPIGPTPLALPASPAPIDPHALDEAGLTFADRQAGLLSADVPESASGVLVVVPGSSPAPGADRRVVTVRVEVEDGLDVDPAIFADVVMATLNDPRGWGADGSVTFARTDGDADIRVVLASPRQVDSMCAPLDTGGAFSCGRNGHAALNYTRWVQATPEFADRTQYREYLVNHEVGHLLGHPHVDCPGEGERAPLMQQQSVSLAPCVANGWPFPDAG